MKSIASILLCLIILTSCGRVNYEKQATDFYQAMNASSLSQLELLYSDSVRIGNDGEFITYSFEEYQHWLSWDSTFHPTYKVLEIEMREDFAEVTISKECNRILYLNGEPTVYKEKLTFKNKRIQSVESTELILFNTEKWVSRRDTLVDWIAENEPKLDGFIFDQTKQGAINYLKAIELYEAKIMK